MCSDWAKAVKPAMVAGTIVCVCVFSSNVLQWKLVLKCRNLVYEEFSECAHATVKNEHTCLCKPESADWTSKCWHATAPSLCYYKWKCVIIKNLSASFRINIFATIMSKTSPYVGYRRITLIYRQVDTVGWALPRQVRLTVYTKTRSFYFCSVKKQVIDFIC